MPTPLRAGLVLLALSSPALAQQVTLGFGGGGANLTSIPFNQGSCNSNNSYIVTWTSSGLSSGNACGNTQIFLTNSQSCPDTPNTTGADGGSQDLVIGTIDINTIATGSGTIPSQRMRDMPGLGGNCPDGQDITNAVCASLSYRATGSTSCDSNLTSSTTLTLHYDAKPPVPPGMNVLAQDSKIVVQLDPQGETLLRYDIQYAEAPPNDGGPDWRQATNLEATKTSESITGLTNGVVYLVRAQSIRRGGESLGIHRSAERDAAGLERILGRVQGRRGARVGRMQRGGCRGALGVRRAGRAGRADPEASMRAAALAVLLGRVGRVGADGGADQAAATSRAADRVHLRAQDGNVDPADRR